MIVFFFFCICSSMLFVHELAQTHAPQVAVVYNVIQYYWLDFCCTWLFTCISVSALFHMHCVIYDTFRCTRTLNCSLFIIIVSQIYYFIHGIDVLLLLFWSNVLQRNITEAWTFLLLLGWRKLYNNNVVHSSSSE